MNSTCTENSDFPKQNNNKIQLPNAIIMSIKSYRNQIKVWCVASFVSSQFIIMILAHPKNCLMNNGTIFDKCTMAAISSFLGMIEISSLFPKRCCKHKSISSYGQFCLTFCDYQKWYLIWIKSVS